MTASGKSEIKAYEVHVMRNEYHEVFDLLSEAQANLIYSNQVRTKGDHVAIFLYGLNGLKKHHINHPLED